MVAFALGSLSGWDNESERRRRNTQHAALLTLHDFFADRKKADAPLRPHASRGATMAARQAAARQAAARRAATAAPRLNPCPAAAAVATTTTAETSTAAATAADASNAAANITAKNSNNTAANKDDGGSSSAFQCHVLDDPRGFLKLNSASVAVGIAPDFPLKQIVADIARPAVIIRDKCCLCGKDCIHHLDRKAKDGEDDNGSDPMTPRVAAMLKVACKEVKFPGDELGAFGGLIYIPKFIVGAFCFCFGLGYARERRALS
ncbi:hypothetical protein B0T26DRAFT_753804 [Lasiosphaeria miniovina]|uniref:Uncharacterized protein n=1 Tax=Lasiosphaeria miniovina TaxID=1954250 RepID=A0AA40AD62_9PEZI|nr:uncharacterized protein B0T26DRAFT_753804 [Lasiosphaeria miniovina]KAK0713716.1 hypothetical protein B0T26DRAFT_753804 [Lasiosphaeria miniovina]